MQMVMLALVESIRGTLRTAGWKLQSVLASETAQAWIITSNAFTVHASGRTCSLLFFHLNCLPLCLRRLRGNDAVGGFFLPTFYFARFPTLPVVLVVHFLCFFIPSLLFLLRLSVCLSVSLHSEVHDTATSKLFISDHSLHLPCCSAPFVQNVVSPHPTPPPSHCCRACTRVRARSAAHVLLLM